MSPAPPLQLEGITVEFGATRALDDLSVTFEAGRVVGLLGHNGAGKSTLLNVATGAVAATRGRFLVDGRPIAPGTRPATITGMGVTVVHQVPSLIGSLSVLDNLFLCQEHLASRRSRAGRAREALERVGRPDIPLDAPAAELQLAEKQTVALARGFVAGDVRALLLDEPTAALGKDETDALHRLIREIARESAAVVYVSHRLPDIMEVCDEVVVLRDGRLVDSRPTAGLSPAALARALAPDLAAEERVATSAGAVALEVDRPSQHLQFRAGEVVGLFGVAAGEQFQLLEGLQGLRGPGSAPVARLDGRPFAPASPAAAIRQGVHTVAADRDKDGLVAEMTAQENVYLPWYGKHRTFTARDGRAVGVDEHYQEVRERLQVHGPDGASPVSAFSGGNRQKHMVASWMFPVRPRVLLMAQPTQGVDVAAKADIRRAVRELAADGVCVVVASAESDEIAGLCDRSYVLVRGATSEVARTERFDEDLVAALLTTGAGAPDPARDKELTA